MAGTSSTFIHLPGDFWYQIHGALMYSTMEDILKEPGTIYLVYFLSWVFGIKPKTKELQEKELEVDESEMVGKILGFFSSDLPTELLSFTDFNNSFDNCLKGSDKITGTESQKITIQVNKGLQEMFPTIMEKIIPIINKLQEDNVSREDIKRIIQGKSE